MVEMPPGSAVGLIVAMGAGVYALRLAGLVLPSHAIGPAWDRVLAFVPIAVLAALAVASVGSARDDVGARLLAGIAGALVARWTRQVWACIVAGMLVYGLIQLT